MEKAILLNMIKKKNIFHYNTSAQFSKHNPTALTYTQKNDSTSGLILGPQQRLVEKHVSWESAKQLQNQTDTILLN